MISKMEMTGNIEVSKFQQSAISFLPADDSLVNRWLKFAAVSEKSMTTYKVCLKQLFGYFADNKISIPARADLENFRDYLIDSGKSASTICLYLTATKLFFRWNMTTRIYKNCRKSRAAKCPPRRYENC